MHFVTCGQEYSTASLVQTALLARCAIASSEIMPDKGEWLILLFASTLHE